MSADGELYVSEECRDMFADILNKTFGEGKWSFNLSPFVNMWNMDTFPIIVEIDILEKESDFRIGQAVITSRATIEQGMESRYTELVPIGIAIYKRVDGKLQNVYDDELAHYSQLIIDFNTKKIEESVAKSAIKDLQFPWIEDIRVNKL